MKHALTMKHTLTAALCLLACAGSARAGDNTTVTATADFATWADYPLVKKIGVYQTPLVIRDWLERDLPKLGELDTRAMRLELAWGKTTLYGEPCITGTADSPQYDFAAYDYFFGETRRHCPVIVMSHGYNPPMTNNGDWQLPPTDYDAWQRVNRDCAAHWRATGLYGRYTEVWNEPDFRNLFFKGTQNDYFKIYRAAATGIREGDPDTKIGGPAGAGVSWNGALARYAKRNNLPFDFISGHAYGDPMTQLNSMRDALANYASPEAEMLLTEFAPYPSGDAIHAGGPVEKAEAAMTFFDALPTFLRYTDLSYVTWAQYIDAGNVLTRKSLASVKGDKMGLIDVESGSRKALFNAFQLYGMMPVDRCDISVGSPLRGMASTDGNTVAAVLWNPTDTLQSVSLTLQGLPFDEAVMRVYHIDTTANSWYETRRDGLRPDTTLTVRPTGGRYAVGGVVRPRGVMFVTASADTAIAVCPANRPARLVRTRYWHPQRTDGAPYACFDTRTWTAHLSMNSGGEGLAMVAVEADSLPQRLAFALKTSGGLADNGSTSALAVRIDYRDSAGVYAKSVLLRGPAFHATAPVPQWGTGREPDEAADSIGGIDVRAHAPEGFGGRVIVTFIMQDCGAGAKADIRATAADGESAAIRAVKSSKLKAHSSKAYDLAGRPLSTATRLQIPGIYIVNNKKVIIK